MILSTSIRCTLALMALTGVASAQPVDQPSDQPAAKESGVETRTGGQPTAIPTRRGQAEAIREATGASDYRWRLRVNGDYTFRSDLEDDRGDVAIGRFGGDLGVAIPLDKNMLTIGATTEQSFYDFDLESGSDLADHTQEYGLLARLFIRESDSWGWFVGGNIQSAFETGADFGSSITGGGSGGVQFFANEKFSWSIGAGVNTRIERDPVFLPLIGFNWNFAEKWSCASDGLGVRVAYTPIDDVTLSLGGRYVPREYRLDEDGLAPDGVMVDRRVPIDFRVDWRTSDRWTIVGSVGVDVYQEYRLYDEGGNKLSEFETDPAIVVGLDVVFEF